MRKTISLLVIASLFLLGACSKNADGNEGEKPEADVVSSSNEDADVGQKDNVEKENFKDLGDLEIKLAGDVKLDGQQLSVEGQTNLLEGSELYIDIDWVDGYVIGGNWTATVESDGSFHFETELPEKIKELLTIEIKFEPANQSEEIQEHYGENGERLEGPFIRLSNYSSDEVYYKASAIVEIAQNVDRTEASIAAPKWKKPDDYGKTEIRMDSITVKKDEAYIYVDGESNLLEGTKLRGRALLPNYITSGFIGYTTVNPDGSFRIIFENPETNERIKDLSDFEITIETDMYGTDYPKVHELYGENGENLTGSLIEEEGDGQMAKVVLKEKAE